jgi:hypothetical protein
MLTQRCCACAASSARLGARGALRAPRAALAVLPGTRALTAHAPRNLALASTPALRARAAPRGVATSAARAAPGSEAVRFTVAPADALAAFAAWHARASPLKPTVRALQPLYFPHWAFTVAGAPAGEIYAGARLPRDCAGVLRAPGAAAAPFSPAHLDVGAAAALHAGGAPDARSAAVSVEAFSLFEAPAWALARAAGARTGARLVSRRLLLPGYVVEYSLLGGAVPLVAFVSGATRGVWGPAGDVPLARALAAARDAAARFAAPTPAALLELLRRLHVSPALAQALAGAVAFGARVVARVIFSVPFLALAGASLAAALSTAALAPAARQRALWAAWEATRAREGRAQAGMEDAWVFRGVARAAEAAPPPPPPPRGKLPPAVDEEAFYAVLGVARGATREAITDAFRRQLLLYHPDHAREMGWSDEGANERTRIVLKAYQNLRDAKKRAAHDARGGK